MSKNTQISNFMKIRPVEAELVHVDGRTEDRQTDDGQRDMAKLMFALRNFTNGPKIQLVNVV